MYPNFLIIGPPKCASTSLHYYLGQHPEIYTSKIKETRFFDLHYDKGLQFYENFFNQCNGQKAIGEATPTYSFLPFVADRIKENFPDIKLIICFRNPIERAFSGWLMQRGMGMEKQSFIEAVKINLSQLDELEYKGVSGAKKWLNSNINVTGNINRDRTYIQGSCYSRILETYTQRFHPSQIRIIFFEDLKNNPDKTLSGIFSFLNVDPDFKIPSKEIVNFHINRKFRRVLSKVIGLKNTRFIMQRLPKSLKNPFKKAWQTKKTDLPMLSQEERNFFWNIIKHDVAKLEKMTNRDLQHWAPKNNY